LNTAGYYDDLLRFMRHSVAEGFLSADQMAAVQVGTDPEALLLSLMEQTSPLPAGAAIDLSRV
jgi:predicted Rossmann-fold nucleotide-binding protein